MVGECEDAMQEENTTVFSNHDSDSNLSIVILLLRGV